MSHPVHNGSQTVVKHKQFVRVIMLNRKMKINMVTVTKFRNTSKFAKQFVTVGRMFTGIMV